MGVEGDLKEDKKKLKLFGWKTYWRGRKYKKGVNRAEQLNHLYHLEVDKEKVKKDFIRKRKRAVSELKNTKKKYAKLYKKRMRMVSDIKNKIDPELRRLQRKMQDLQNALKSIQK